MRKKVSILLALLLVLTMLPTGAFAAEETAALSARSLRVDGKQESCQTYDIGGETWFRLRDVALVLRETGSRFSVDWDGKTRTVLLTTGEAYEPDGSEGEAKGELSAAAVPGSKAIKIDGTERTDLPAWNIGGYNYFRLEDLASALGFQADYDKASDTAVICAKVLHQHSSLSARMYTDEISGSYIACEVTNDTAPWLIREEVYNANDGHYSREVTTYGEDGRMLTVFTEGQGSTVTTTFRYDELGRETERVISTVFADGTEDESTLTSEYDLWGQLVRQTADGNITTYTYDDKGNQTAMERVLETPVGEWVLEMYQEYDGNGNRIKAVNVQNGETTESSEYAYDDEGNETRWERFDAAGNRVYAQETVYADGTPVEMTQDYGSYRIVSSFTRNDADGTVTTVTDSPTGRTALLSRDGKPQRQEWTDGTHSSVTVWTYDAAGRLVQIETGDPEAPAQLTVITYDEKGNVLSNIYENGGYREEDVYAYDEAERKMICTRTITYPEASGITLSSDSLTLPVGGVGMLTTAFLPGSSLKETVTWTSSDESVVTVDPAGFVIAVGPGEATVTVTSERGLTAECAVSVTE